MTAPNETQKQILEKQWEAISNLERGFERTATLLDTVASRLGHLEHKINDASKTPWTAVGVLLTIVTLFFGVAGYTYISNLSASNERFSNLEERVLLHQSDGHPARVVAMVEALERTTNQQFELSQKLIEIQVQAINQRIDYVAKQRSRDQF